MIFFLCLCVKKGQVTIFGGLGVIFVYAIVSIVQNGAGNHTEIRQYEISSYPIFFGTAAYVFEGKNVCRGKK